jgi:competence protein ComGC
MEASNIIAIVLGGMGFIISIIGLIVTPSLNLKSKKLEKRLEYRFQLFQKVIELWEYTNDNNHSIADVKFRLMILEVNKLIQLYG